MRGWALSKGWIVYGALLLLGLENDASGQVSPGRHWVGFADKVGCGYDVEEPATFLSSRALDRRVAAGIEVDSLDLPVSAERVAEVLAVGGGSIDLVHLSRWFNGGVFHLTDSASTDSLLGVIGSLESVVEVRSELQFQGERLPAGEAAASSGVLAKNTNALSAAPVGCGAPDYGAASGQAQMLNLHLLHGLGHQGEGQRVAVLDAGFDRADELAPLDQGFDEGRISPALDVVSGGAWQYGHHAHGTMVLSTMVASDPGEIVGSGPGASYHLYRTEDVGSERLIEEYNWTVAAEHADSMGCDIINSSLGYSLFDDSLDHHVYSSLDGETYRISLAAQIAASRGMLVVTSAGNSGDNPWHHITCPADARDILSAGAVDGLRMHANFSGYGPSADGRVKPEVCTQGRDATYLHPDGSVRQGNGTSFSSPILAGAAASLWSAHPEKSAAEVRRAIIESADRFTAPDTAYGHGIPDFWKAHLALGGHSPSTVPVGGPDILLYPNPVSSTSASAGILRIAVSDPQGNAPFANLEWAVFDAKGRLVVAGEVERTKSSLTTFHINTQRWAVGAYILNISAPDLQLSRRILNHP
ncbi:MAG: S8 family serine peptidase [Flavobacteriales bacterium]|nr:S8 family serine peptidase [Flavobacteriales bacterium]